MINAINLSTYKLSSERLAEFRVMFEEYREHNEPCWSDEEIREMAMELISFAVTVCLLSQKTKNQKVL